MAVASFVLLLCITVAKRKNLLLINVKKSIKTPPAGSFSLR
jgi:hypothetical protein